MQFLFTRDGANSCKKVDWLVVFNGYIKSRNTLSWDSETDEIMVDKSLAKKLKS